MTLPRPTRSPAYQLRTVNTPSASKRPQEAPPPNRVHPFGDGRRYQSGEAQGHGKPIPDQSDIVRREVVVGRANAGQQRAQEEYEIRQRLALADERATATQDHSEAQQAPDQERSVRNDVQESWGSTRTSGNRRRRDRTAAVAWPARVVLPPRRRSGTQSTARHASRGAARLAPSVMPRRCRRPFRARDIWIRGSATPRPPTTACRLTA